MKQTGPGILEKSEIYFTSPSPKTKKLYYNVLCAGHFYCDDKYHLVRNSYDSILILHVLDGIFTFKNHEGNFITAEKNETVVLDCYSPHEYYTNDRLESIWIHVAGVNIREFFQEFLNNGGNVAQAEEPQHIKELMHKIFEGVQGNSFITEANLSLEVYKLLLELLNPVPSKATDRKAHEKNIQSVKDYIAIHLNEKITVESLADAVHMSTTHFSRVFKQQTGFSPYDFVLMSRLNKAKEYLLKTDMSVTEIAYETGFNSESNFVYCFTNNEGISPGKFRKLKF